MTLRDHLHFMETANATLREKGPPPGFAFHSIHGLIAVKGHTFPSRDLTEDEAVWFREASIGHPYAQKECFRNAQRFVLYEHAGLPAGWTLTYAEGFVAMRDLPIPILHGWIMLNDKVIDPTIRRGKPKKRDRLSDRALGAFTDREYIGLLFTVDQVRERVLAMEEWSSFLDDYRNEFPLLKRGAI